MREQERKLGEKNTGDKYTCKELVEKKKGVTEGVKKWEGYEIYSYSEPMCFGWTIKRCLQVTGARAPRV